MPVGDRGRKPRRREEIGQPQAGNGDLGKAADVQCAFGGQGRKALRAVGDQDIQDIVLDDRKIMPPRHLDQFRASICWHQAGQRVDDIGLQIDSAGLALARNLVQCRGNHPFVVHRHAVQMQPQITAKRHQRVVGQRLGGQPCTGRHYAHKRRGDRGTGAIGDGDAGGYCPDSLPC